MKFRYLGTAAAEGVPAIFCACENCRRARAIGGRALRSRSQAIVDDELLIDFPADTYCHFLREGLDMAKVHTCIVTHAHSDHLYPADLEMIRPGFSHLPKEYSLAFYGTKPVIDRLEPYYNMLAPDQRHIASLNEILPFSVIEAGKYRITVLPAVHDPKSGPVFYMIEDGEKTVLYANDTDYFCDEVWAYFETVKPKFDLVSLDCTNCLTFRDYIGHMGIERNLKIRRQFLALGYATEGTVFVCHHFSHNGEGAVYDDMIGPAAKEGFLVSYDGMVLEI